MRVPFVVLTLAGASVMHADCVSGSTRPPTPAESSFEIKSKTALQNALAGTLPEGWQNARPIGSIKAASNYCTGDDRPIQLGYHVDYENAVKKRDALSKITAKTAADPVELAKITEEASYDTDLKITIAANNPICGISGASIQTLDVPGAKLAVRSTTNKITTTVVCLGNWQLTKTGAHFDLPPKGARTTIQNLTVRIQAEPARADQVLKQIKLRDLSALVGR